MIEKNIRLATDWLSSSGIHIDSPTSDVSGRDMKGALYAWFDSEKKTYSYIYPEICGYALTTFLFLHEELKEPKFLDSSKEVADWLLKTQNQDGSHNTAFYIRSGDNHKPDEYHTFDIGMIFNGLANYAQVSGEKKYLEAAIKGADFVLRFQNEDGSIAAQISGDGSYSICDTEKTWSTQSGVYHTKLAIGFLNIYSQTQDGVYKKAAEKLCKYAVEAQQKDGQFFTYGELSGTNLHPHLYAAEGLYVAGSYLDEDLYINAAKKAVIWAVENTKEGVVPRYKHGAVFNYNERIDVLAQTYRLASILLGDEHSLAVTTIRNKLLEYQYDGNQTEQVGGFLFGKLSDGTVAKHINCWTTQFALQALILEKNKNCQNIFHLV